MPSAEDFKVERESQQKVDSIVNKLYGNTDQQIADFAKHCVDRRYPVPAYRERRSGEHERQHAQFVAGRLRLVWAMRRYATLNLPASDPYKRYLDS